MKENQNFKMFQNPFDFKGPDPHTHETQTALFKQLWKHEKSFLIHVESIGTSSRTSKNMSVKKGSHVTYYIVRRNENVEET